MLAELIFPAKPLQHNTSICCKARVTFHVVKFYCYTIVPVYASDMSRFVERSRTSKNNNIDI